MANCSFCGTKIPDNEGLMSVRKDGKVDWFCRSKCERNDDLGREPRTTRWVK